MAPVPTRIRLRDSFRCHFCFHPFHRSFQVRLRFTPANRFRYLEDINTFVSGMAPPPMPPPNWSGMSLEELRQMEDAERRGVEARLQCLRNIHTFMDASVLLMQQYLASAAVAAAASASTANAASRSADSSANQSSDSSATQSSDSSANRSSDSSFATNIPTTSKR